MDAAVEASCTSPCGLEALKLKGNAAFKGIYILNAIDPSNPACYSNLSMTFLKMGDFEEALYWAQSAIKADPKFTKVFTFNTKGYYRRAMAYIHLMNLNAAKADLLLVSKLNPTDQDVQGQLAKCNGLLREKAFLEAIKVEMLSLTMESIEKIEVSPSYDGPVFTEPITKDFVFKMIDRFKNDKLIDQKSTLLLMLRAKEFMEKQDSLVNIKVPSNSRITVCGDTHGQFFDFIQIFDQVAGYPSEEQFYLFNGDFVDRGAYSVEIVLTLIAFKLLYPNSFFLSRGNHEFYSLNKVYGFEAEVKKKFDASYTLLFSELFKSMPICHLINDQVFVTHGGLHSGTTTLNEIRSINRFVDAPSGSLFESLLWSDPSTENGVRPSHRGAGVMFGPDITKQFLSNNNLKYVIRSHEFKPSGYEVSHDGLLYTIFSAPNYYPGQSSLGAVLNIEPLSMKVDAVQFSANSTQGKASKPQMSPFF